ncbi:V4R domain-containing protein [Methanobrevibacter sp. DSM 116169]|uniref:V4R domain-containing protein n=1 Tax=Methanobrevibacter sp. DSM 116169 TaxID=3242727 RepID=UPI0038FCF4B3
MNTNENYIKQKPIQIFSGHELSNDVNVIKSEVKLTILEMLKTKHMEFDEIVKNTGKSKSTVSVHLKDLREKGIISFKVNPSDSRKKIFHLNSRFLGSINTSSPIEIEERKKEYLIDNILNKDDFEFSLLLFHTLRSSLIQEGVNIDPILHDTGLSIGNAIFEKLYDETFDKFLANVSEFWQNQGLGIISVDIGQIIKITSVDCFECGLLPKTGKPACFLDAGIIEALFSNYFGFPVDVIEVQCYTMGDGQCTFEVEPKKS